MADENAVTQDRVVSITNPSNDMGGDVSTPKCSKMLADINAQTADLDAAARALKAGPPENVYGL